MALAALHTLVICAFGNNMTPASQKSAPSTTTTTSSEGFRFPGLPVTAKKASRPPPAADEAAAFTPVVQPAQPFDQPPAPAVPARRHDDGNDANLPAWMRP